MLVTQSCPTLPPHGLQPARLLCPQDSQARILEWVAISFSRGSSQPRDRAHVSCIVGRFFTIWATRAVHIFPVVISPYSHQILFWGLLSFFFFPILIGVKWCLMVVLIQSILKEIRPGCSLEGLMLKLKHLVLWPPDAENWLIGKDSDAGKDWGQEEKGTTEDEMVGWHHQLNGHGFGWTPGVGDGQGALACCDSRGRKELDTTEWLNWTMMMVSFSCAYWPFIYLLERNIYSSPLPVFG